MLLLLQTRFDLQAMDDGHCGHLHRPLLHRLRHRRGQIRRRRSVEKKGVTVRFFM